MADVEWHGPIEPASLRRALRLALRRRDPSLRVVAEDVLAAVSSIDLLAVGIEGELVAIRIDGAIEAEHDDAGARLLTRGLADLTWLRPRAADLIKLAPGLGLELDAEPRAILVAPRFGPEAMAAAENLPARSIDLLRWRGLRQQGQLGLLLEPEKPGLVRALAPEAAASIEAPPPARPRAVPNPVDDLLAPAPRAPSERRPLIDPPSASTFRTGLTDDDLRLDSPTS